MDQTAPTLWSTNAEPEPSSTPPAVSGHPQARGISEPPPRAGGETGTARSETPAAEAGPCSPAGALLGSR